MEHHITSARYRKLNACNDVTFSYLFFSKCQFPCIVSMIAL